MELFQPGHLIPLLIVVAVLFFGWKQMPDMARSLGRSLRVFKTEIKGMSADDKAREAADDAPVVTQPRAIEGAVPLAKQPVAAEPVIVAPVAAATPVAATQPVSAAQPVSATRPRPAPRPDDAVRVTSDQ